ncbi:MAG: hypothetical protein ACQESG_03095 [Nanobdellota archaeon]
MVFSGNAEFNRCLSAAEGDVLCDEAMDGSGGYADLHLGREGRSYASYFLEGLVPRIVEVAQEKYRKQTGQRYRGGLNNNITNEMLLRFAGDENPQGLDRGSLERLVRKPRIEGLNRLRSIYYGSAMLDLPEEAWELLNPIQRMALYDGFGRIKATPEQYVPKRINGQPVQDVFQAPVDELMYELASFAAAKCDTYEELAQAYGAELMDGFRSKAGYLSRDDLDELGHQLRMPAATFETHRTGYGRERLIMVQIPDPYQKDPWTSIGQGLRAPSKKLLKNYMGLIRQQDAL